MRAVAQYLRSSDNKLWRDSHKSIYMLMERRVKGNLHARCGPGEKPETVSKAYLSVSGAKSQGMKQLMVFIRTDTPFFMGG